MHLARILRCHLPPPRTQELSGIDIELAAALAADLNVRVVYVDSSFPTLVSDLVEDRCDVAMFAVGVTAQRAEKLRFTQPYLRSDIYGITTKSNQVVREWSDIDKPGCWSPFNPAPSWSR